MEKKMTYTEAVTELERIVAEIEQGSVTVDELAEKVRRATVLLLFCRETLTGTETEVKKILDQ